MEQIRKGRIIKGVGGFYTLLTDDGETYVCKARGLFRKQGLTPLPGDEAEFSVDKRKEGYIRHLLPRRNELVRPSVVNVDTLLIVISATEPEPDPELADKLLIYCGKQGIRPVIVINKCDGGETEDVKRLAAQYSDAASAVITVSAESGYGLDDLRSMLTGSTICLAGQSAVGKSSLLNALMGLQLKTGGLSEKTERGRHTTRHAELIPMPGGGLIADTPGFSMLETVSIEPEEIPGLYPDFKKYEGDCRFIGCLHASEPGCAVKKSVDEGLVDRERYARYLKILNEAIEMRRHKYD